MHYIYKLIFLFLVTPFFQQILPPLLKFLSELAVFTKIGRKCIGSTLTRLLTLWQPFNLYKMNKTRGCGYMQNQNIIINDHDLTSVQQPNCILRNDVLQWSSD